MTRLTRDVRHLLGSADPAADQPLVTEADRRADRDRILASAPAHQHRPARPLRRRLLMTAAAGIVLAAAVVAGYPFVPLPSPAYAATPAPLNYTGGGGPAKQLLSTIAQRASAAAPAPRTGDHEHLVVDSWHLWTQVDGEQVSSAVIPAHTESWRAPDNSGRRVTEYGEPQFPPGTSAWPWRLRFMLSDDLDTRTEDLPAGQYSSMWPDDPPVAGLDTWLHRAHPKDIGPHETIVAVTDLVRDRVLTPAVRAEALRLIAQLPGLRYDGTATDRAGRPGAAFSLETDRHGLPERYTLIIDERTGTLLGYEQMLTTSAGRLPVRVPAVIGYETYLTAEFSPAPR